MVSGYPEFMLTDCCRNKGKANTRILIRTPQWSLQARSLRSTNSILLSLLVTEDYALKA